MFGFVMAFSGTAMAVGGFWSDASMAPSLADTLVREAAGLMDAGPPSAASG